MEFLGSWMMAERVDWTRTRTSSEKMEIMEAIVDVCASEHVVEECMSVVRLL
jgi:hypothetical protein